MYMLDSDQEPSYNLSKNILLLPRILKLIEDMVDDSTPLISSNTFTLLYILFIRIKTKFTTIMTCYYIDSNYSIKYNI